MHRIRLARSIRFPLFNLSVLLFFFSWKVALNTCFSDSLFQLGGERDEEFFMNRWGEVRYEVFCGCVGLCILMV
mgnify:CR=1 FL=1